MERALRIGLLINIAPKKLGGAERWMLAFAREASGRGHAVHVATATPALEEWVDELKSLGATWGTIGALGSSSGQVRQSLQSRFDIVQLNLLAPRSSQALGAYGARGVAVVFVDRVSDEESEDGHRLPVLRRIASTCADRLTMRFIDKFVGISEYVTRRAIRRFGGPQDTYTTIYHGVDVAEYAPRQRSGRDTVIVAVAHLIPQKGIDVLLEACARLGDRHYRLHVVGDGPDRTRLEHLAHELNLGSRVRFFGLRSDVNEILSRSDIFVHPATWNEAFGYTVAEAMSAGCAVIASDVGAIPELLGESAGVVVPAGSPEAIRHALARLLDYPHSRRKLADAARARAIRMFDVNDSASAHVSVCESVVDGSNQTTSSV